jgi:glycosyltransferase involved in cell wall biosynthesis
LGDGLRACHAVLAPSAAHAQAVERVHGQVPGLRVVYNASFDTGEPERERERLALAAGRWWDDGKNGATLDRAASVCRWPVLMAGAVEGPNGQRFQARHARALGPLSPDVLRRRLRRAAVAVVPSRYEPFGLVALEAALSGCALVLSDIPVFRELWEGAARFVDPADATGFAETIEALLEDEPARAELARHARLRAGRFSPSRQAARLLVAYRDCLAAVSPPPRLKGLA